MSEYQKKDCGLPPTKNVEIWKQYGSDLDALSAEREGSSIEPPEKANAKSSKDEVATSQERDVSSLRKNSRLPSAMNKSSSKEVSST